jgi:hypothetical protein
MEEDMEDKFEERSTEYLRGVQDCVGFLAEALVGGLPEESGGWDVLDHIKTNVEFYLHTRFMRDLNVSPTWEGKHPVEESKALEKTPEKEA